MAHRNIVLGINEKMMPPDDILKGLMDRYKTSTSVAFVDEGVVEFIAQSGVPDLEGPKGLKATLKDFEDFERVVSFGSHSSDYLADDMQPFVLMSSNDGKPHLCC